jgi:glycosyltransferase involved in cell wall biosynthesis
MVTPMPVTSAIARVMIAATTELAARCDIEIWCPDLGPRFSAPVRVHEFGVATETQASQLSRYDLVLYAVGDSPWHREVVRLARAVPGLVVLHDVSVTNLVWAMHAARDASADLIDAVRRRQGDAVADELATAAQTSDNPRWSELCQEVPLLDYVLRGSLGVVVHSLWAAREIEGLTLGEVTVAPLPIPTGVFGGTDASIAGKSRVLGALPSDAVVVATVGSVNANRRIAALVEAIAGDPVLRARAHLIAAGAVSDGMRETIDAAAARLGVQDRVHLPGAVDDDEMLAILARADVCAALRDPVLEAKSASLLSQMHSGTPVMVLDHGHYAELPDDVVAKIAVQGGIPAIRAMLRSLVDDPDTATAIGSRGLDFVTRTHTAAAYADALALAAEFALATRPVMDMTRSLGERIGRIGLTAEPAIQRSLSETAFDLFALD